MMSNMTLKQLSPNDGNKVYEMLQRIGKDENAFTNPVNGMTYEQYKQWLVEQDDWAHGLNIPDGYVGQTVFWLINDNNIVGYGKIRHQLTKCSKEFGGNIGYAIDPLYRGKGYATVLLQLLLEQAKIMGISEIMLTVEKYNYPSKIVIEKNGGELFKENDLRWFFRF